MVRRLGERFLQISCQLDLTSAVRVGRTHYLLILEVYKVGGSKKKYKVDFVLGAVDWM